MMTELDDLQKRSTELQKEMRKNVEKAYNEDSFDPIFENLKLINEQNIVCKKIVSLLLKNL